MARPLRLEFPGAVYHVTSRGNRREPIFLDNDDRQRFLGLLQRVTGRFGWLCFAYCLMNNHYHLLIETPRANLALGMQTLNSAYAQSFNARHGCVGHVLQGRYGAILVEQEGHLLEVARYVVLNPVRACFVRHPGEWLWSSYRATAGHVGSPRFLASETLLGHFGTSRARARYRLFVEDGAGRNPWTALHGGLYLGSEEFARRHAPAAHVLPEIRRGHVRPVRPPLVELLQGPSKQAIATAYHDHGYRLREIADYLGVHYATVSRRLRSQEGDDGEPQCKI